MMRAEPSDFAILARRFGKAWDVAGVSADAKVLTIRLEDLWMRTPKASRASAYSVEIVRDPNTNETGPSVTESFTGLWPDACVELEVKANGGFLLSFKPED